MSYQERPRQPHKVIKKDDLDNVLQRISATQDEKTMNNFARFMMRNEPHLDDLIMYMSRHMSSPEPFIIGARVFYGVLKMLEDDDYKFPKVSREIIRTYKAEFDVMLRRIDPAVLKSEASKKEKAIYIAKAISGAEFRVPSAFGLQ